MVGCWVRARTVYVVHDTDEFVRLGEELVELPVAGNGVFGAVRLHGRAIAGVVTGVAASQA